MCHAVIQGVGTNSKPAYIALFSPGKTGRILIELAIKYHTTCYLDNCEKHIFGNKMLKMKVYEIFKIVLIMLTLSAMQTKSISRYILYSEYNNYI